VEDRFLDIYRAHRTPLFRFVWRMTGSVETAEDVTQECFLALMRGAAFDERQSQLRTYLFGVARHLVFRRLRISGRETDEPTDARDTADALGDLLSMERSEQVRHAVAGLPPLQREAIILFEYEDLPLESIAAITGVQVGAVKARLQRARESLRRQLSPLIAHSENARSEKRSCS